MIDFTIILKVLPLIFLPVYLTVTESTYHLISFHPSRLYSEVHLFYQVFACDKKQKIFSFLNILGLVSLSAVSHVQYLVHLLCLLGLTRVIYLILFIFLDYSVLFSSPITIYQLKY